MKFDKAVKHLADLRTEKDEITREAKVRAGKIQEEINRVEAKLKEKADEAGLSSIKTEFGTVFWTTHYSCSVAAPSDFFDYVKDSGRWELIEKRASKLAVKDFIDETGEVPPGVNFAAYMALNLRRS